MKKEYSKPKVDVAELDLEGTLCTSVPNQNDAVIDGTVTDPEYKW